MKTFERAQWSAVVAAVLGLVAMLLYPGGTVLEHDTSRYRITQNFLSDLGMTVAYNGQPNRIGSALFVVSLGALILGFGGATIWFIRLYSSTPKSRIFAWGAGIVGLAVCLSFVGVAFTPENAAMSMHVQFTLFAFRIFPLSAALMFLAAWQSGVASSRVVGVWVFVTVSLIAYAAFLTFGPSAKIPNGLVAFVIAQKCITVAIIGALAFLCRDAARTLRTNVAR